MRKMILSKTKEDRLDSLKKLLPYQQNDFFKIFKIMNGLPVTVRLLDPPLHEFLPKTTKEVREVAQSFNLTEADIEATVEESHGHKPKRDDDPKRSRE